jgi:hypothetical protein
LSETSLSSVPFAKIPWFDTRGFFSEYDLRTAQLPDRKPAERGSLIDTNLSSLFVVLDCQRQRAFARKEEDLVFPKRLSCRLQFRALFDGVGRYIAERAAEKSGTPGR